MPRWEGRNESDPKDAKGKRGFCRCGAALAAVGVVLVGRGGAWVAVAARVRVVSPVAGGKSTGAARDGWNLRGLYGGDDGEPEKRTKKSMNWKRMMKRGARVDFADETTGPGSAFWRVRTE